MKLDNMGLTERLNLFSTVVGNAVATSGDGARVPLEAGLMQAMQLLTAVRTASGSVFIVGNGGSAAIAAHAVVDFVNVAKLRAFVLHDPALMTCMANDYGYEKSYDRVLAQIARPDDLLIAISSSGKSPNIVNAAAQARHNGCAVITFTGFEATNPLRTAGTVNIWLDAKDYGIVEVGHQFVLHNLSDRFKAAESR